MFIGWYADISKDAVMIVVMAGRLESGLVTAGYIVSIVSIFPSLMNSMIIELSNEMNQTVRARHAVKALIDFEALEDEEGAFCLPKQGMDFTKIEFRQVSFRYPGTSKWVLRNLDMCFEKGRHYINSFLKPLTDEKRKDVFIVDDSLFDRSRSKKVELLARVFSHCSMKYRSGFRMLTLGWSDGNSFVPVSYSLLSAAEDRNLLCNAGCYDGRSLAGRRRRQSRRKATDVMLELIHSTQCAGITARYVLFDNWFSAPKTIMALKEQEHLDTIAMLKKSRAKYTCQGERLNVKEIYSRNKKRMGRSRYLLSVPQSCYEQKIYFS